MFYISTKTGQIFQRVSSDTVRQLRTNRIIPMEAFELDELVVV
jgi:hypothetical protein